MGDDEDLAAPLEQGGKKEQKIKQRLSIRVLGRGPKRSPRAAKPLSIGVAWPGARHQLNLNDKTTILQVKEEVCKLSQIPVLDQQLTYKGKLLKKDKKSLGKYGIEDDRTIVLTRLSAAPVGKAAKKKAKAADPAPKPAGIPSLNKAFVLAAQQPAVIDKVDAEADGDQAVGGGEAAEAAAPKEMSAAERAVMEAASYVPDEEQDLAPVVHAGISMDPANQEFLDKEEMDDVVKFFVTYEKKDHKMKMAQNTDIWAVMMELEKMGLGKAGHMHILMGEEELDEEEMLDEAGVEHGVKLQLHFDE